MHLIIHSLYTNKEIFLRELISNAADAIDKVRFLSITDQSLNIDQSNLRIRISIDPEKGTIIISDNGIGMTREELKTNLGTIAKSGTAEFIKKLEENDDKSLIGQFGVGFYSSYLVAENVTVISRKAGTEETNVWESNGEGFIVRDLAEGEEPLKEQGTTIILALKDKYFLDTTVIKELVRKYSEFIQFPIEVLTTKKEEEEVEDTEAMREEAKEKAKAKIESGENEGKTEEELIEEELKNVEVKHKFVSKNVTSWEAVNTNKPIWMRNDVTDEEYNAFYKALTKDEKEPLAKVHFNTEGDSVFRALLYIPQEGVNPFAPKDEERMKQMLRLYVRRVFVSGDFYKTLPEYLNFIRGVIDSDDLPLNIGREMIQK